MKNNTLSRDSKIIQSKVAVRLLNLLCYVQKQTMSGNANYQSKICDMVVRDLPTIVANSVGRDTREMPMANGSTLDLIEYMRLNDEEAMAVALQHEFDHAHDMILDLETVAVKNETGGYDSEPVPTH